MASEGQRRRRRRAKQRRRSSITTRVVTGNPYGPRKAGNNLSGQTYNPAIWYTESYEFIINTLVTPAPVDLVWTTRLNDLTALKGRIDKAGEYRLLKLVARYSPIAATTNDRICLSPYFADENRLLTAASMVSNGRRIRKADTNFQVSWDVPTAATSTFVAAGQNFQDLPGGVCVYFKGTSYTDFGLIAVTVTYQFRGKKTEAGFTSANP